MGEDIEPDFNSDIEDETQASKYLLRDIENLKDSMETFKDVLGNINMRILENKEHVSALDKRMSIFVPRRTNDNG